MTIFEYQHLVTLNPSFDHGTSGYHLMISLEWMCIQLKCGLALAQQTHNHALQEMLSAYPKNAKSCIYFGERSYKMRAFDKRRNSISTIIHPTSTKHEKIADFCGLVTLVTQRSHWSQPPPLSRVSQFQGIQGTVSLAGCSADGSWRTWLTSKIGATNPKPHQPVSSYFTSAISEMCPFHS